MPKHSDLQIHINDEETFVLDKVLKEFSIGFLFLVVYSITMLEDSGCEIQCLIM